MWKFLKNCYQKTVECAQSVGRQALAVVASAAGAVGLLTSTKPAEAALDASIATGLTQVQTDFTALLALVYPIMISITAAVVIFGMAKMFIHKAAGK